jgi:hypothetical protein
MMESKELKQLLVNLMETLVPGEEYSFDITEFNGQYKFELRTESKRAMIAWAEISFHLEECIDKEQSKSLGFD